MYWLAAGAVEEVEEAEAAAGLAVAVEWAVLAAAMAVVTGADTPVAIAAASVEVIKVEALGLLCRRPGRGQRLAAETLPDPEAEPSADGQAERPDSPAPAALRAGPRPAACPAAGRALPPAVVHRPVN